MRTLSVAALAVLCSAGVAAGTSGSYPKLSFLYESDEAVRAMIGGSEAMRNLNWVYRVEPSNSAPDTKFVGGDTQRASKYNGRSLAAFAAPDMAAELMRVIDDSCPTPGNPAGTCQAHLVLVDEIGNWFGGPNGRPSSSGRRLLNAMLMLDATPSPWGGSYASRVHFALAPGPATSVAFGFGRNRTLGRDGRQTRRNYRDVFGAMARGGGVWIEAFHHNGDRYIANSPEEWRQVGVGVASFLSSVRSRRNSLTYTHFVFGNVQGPQARCRIAQWRAPRLHPRADYAARQMERFTEDDALMERAKKMAKKDKLTAVSPLPQVNRMDCDWQRAQNNPVNLRILSQGPAAISLAPEGATTWGAWFRRWFVER